MASRKRFTIGATVLLATITFWACMGASSGWQYYLTADECIQDMAYWTGRPIRVSGRISDDSLQVQPHRQHVAFRMAGSNDVLTVSYDGPTPDNLAEGREVVVEGVLNEQGILQASQVLTRCASKYSSEPERQEEKAPDRR